MSRRTLAALLLCVSVPAPADAQDEASDFFKFMAEEARTMSLATGSRQPVSRAPAAGSVITASDIADIGATDLDEALEAVPGLHVSRSARAYNPVYTIRGVRSALTNPEVLMLVNGIPLTTVNSGDRGILWGGLSVEDIARIEVIRGPGSALYGADAFAGVINIITKTAADINGTRFGARGGSFRTRDVWGLHGRKWGPVEVAAYLHAGASDGPRSIIAADNQTGLDARLGTRASLAPGPINVGREAYDGRLDLASGAWRLRAGVMQRDRAGTGPGNSQALDPAGRNSSQRLTADLTYNERFARDWDVTLQGSLFHFRDTSDLVLFPPGAFGGTFPNGVIGNPYKWERHARVNVSAFYTGFESHRLRLGAGREVAELYRTRETKNFDFAGVAPVPLGSVVDVSDTKPFLRPHDRKIDHVYVQDEWGFAAAWTLTAGVRHDRYSDVGNTTNPRLALVWEASENLTFKALYGRAFRPPSFVELFSINNPVNTGNARLKPETIETEETAVAWRPKAGVALGLNLFRYERRDVIVLVPNAAPAIGSTAQNSGVQVGRGLELEGSWDATEAMRLSGNYAYQDSVDQTTRHDAGGAPHHHAYLRARWRFTPGWAASTSFNGVFDRRRAPGDARADIAGYHTVDLTVRTQEGRRPWDLVFSVRNLFDADAREPSPSPGLIPGDLPLPGRSYVLQASYRL